MKYSEMEIPMSQQLIDITRELIRKKENSIWKQPTKEQIERVDVWNTKASEMFGISKPKVIVKGGISPCYFVLEHKIFLDKVSVVSLFHEFAHAIQTKTGQPKMEAEKWARIFSCRLFRMASPLNYKRACERKMLIYE